MEWSPSITIALVEQSLRQLSVLIDQDLVASPVVSFLAGDPDVPEEFLLVSSLLLRQELSLAQAFLRFVYKSIN